MIRGFKTKTYHLDGSINKSKFMILNLVLRILFSMLLKQMLAYLEISSIKTYIIPYII